MFGENIIFGSRVFQSSQANLNTNGLTLKLGDLKLKNKKK